MLLRHSVVIAVTCVMGLATSIAVGQGRAAPYETLGETVEKAIFTNPEVRAQFQTFIASLETQNFTRGDLLPSVDLQAQFGREQRANIPGSPSQNWTRYGYTLQLTQLLYDGQATANSIRQQGFEKLSAYYELLATTDSLATEAVNAYLDVQRFREMVQYAEENYAIHEKTMTLIRERQESGVGRGVDYEQAAGRLALAQSNLMQENNNLNDVVQRYRRIVGQYPPDVLSPPPDVSDKIPKEPRNFRSSLVANPSILSKQALVIAAKASREAAKGQFAPVVELRASTGRDRPQEDPTAHDIQTSNVQVVMSYNLYRGGSDSARVRQTAAQWYAARDVRDYTCRNLQQELSTAWNNIQRLRQQRPYLAGHEAAMEKVRVAAEQQFEIGQRSLLDLLDTSNELFDSRRALANGVYDLLQAEYRWIALSHRLLPVLGLSQPHEQTVPENTELSLPESSLDNCMTPTPDTRNLAPVKVTYRDDMQPPRISPLNTGVADDSSTLN
ncbi:TolC family outer membrane protein [Neopusillimonas maritima]|nr:TolC family outer membrane protein [Neopusillimonas maritima]